MRGLITKEDILESMNLEEYEAAIEYLGNEINSIRNSREYIFGKKLVKYAKYLKRGRFLEIIDSLFHDIGGIPKRKNQRIIDFNKEKKVNDGKITIYTSIYGEYDEILNPLVIEPDCEYVLFTDKDIPEDTVWKKGDESQIPLYCDTPVLKNRYVKMHPHKLFNTNYSLYIDGNLQIVGHASYLLLKEINENKTGIAMHRHPRDFCVYQEAYGARYWKKISWKQYFQIVRFLKRNKMPRNYGMYECNVIARNHNRQECIDIMEQWWNLFRKGIKRDQLYFTFVLYKLGYVYSDVANYGASVNMNPFFIRREHKS